MYKFNMFLATVCVLFLLKLRWPKNKSIYEVSVFLSFSDVQYWIVQSPAVELIESNALESNVFC